MISDNDFAEVLNRNPQLKIKRNHTRLAQDMSEKDLLASVQSLAQVRGWLIYHTYESRNSDRGFPDLVLVRTDRILFVELKSAKGKLSREQATWLSALMLAGQSETYIWTPAQWLDGTIEGLLK